MAEEVKVPEGKITRRRFLDYLLGASIVISLGAVVGAVLDFIYPPQKGGGAEAQERMEVGPVSDRAPCVRLHPWYTKSAPRLEEE